MKKNKIAKDGSVEKMTIYEYEQKYVKRQNVRGAKWIIWLVAMLIGVFLFFCLFSITMRIWEINEYAGYGVAGVSVLLFIFLYIVPIIKIMRSNYFIVNVNAYTAGKAKKHNKKVRYDIADKIIDVTSKVEGVGWYDSKTVGEMAIALRANDDKGVMKSLSNLYTGSIKKAAHDLIFKCSMKSAMYSALSQSEKIDAALIAVTNLQLVKDLVFLYGFRPSQPKLIKIFGRVLQNSLIAYGLGGIKIGNSIVKTMGDAIRDIPVLGSVISVIVDSSVQGLTNGVLTATIGYQTISYLNKEYRLQEILDGIDLPEVETEFEKTCSELATELKKNKKAPNAA